VVDKAEFQGLVDGLVQEVLKLDEWILDVKESTFIVFFRTLSSCWSRDTQSSFSYLTFSVQGTGTPRPSKHIQFHTLGQPAFDRVCHQFAIVYGHLRKAFVTQVNIIIPELLKTNRESDSSDEEVPEMCDVRLLSYTRWPNEMSLSTSQILC